MDNSDQNGPNRRQIGNNMNCLLKSQPVGINKYTYEMTINDIFYMPLFLRELENHSCHRRFGGSAHFVTSTRRPAQITVEISMPHHDECTIANATGIDLINQTNINSIDKSH